MHQCLAELHGEWQRRGLPLLNCRVGINTQPMIVGNIGAKNIFDYTVIGDAVNLASRLEGTNKLYGTSLIVSEYTHARLTPNMFRTRILDFVRVKGKRQAVKIYEVYGFQDKPVDNKYEAYCHRYEQGFDAYLLKDFKLAVRRFSQALDLNPKDPASQQLIRRIRSLDKTNLNSEWDGSVTLTLK